MQVAILVKLVAGSPVVSLLVDCGCQLPVCSPELVTGYEYMAMVFSVVMKAKYAKNLLTQKGAGDGANNGLVIRAGVLTEGTRG